MNGIPVEISDEVQVNQDLINKLAKYLADAKAGRLMAGIMVFCTDKDNVGGELSMLPGYQFSLNVGLDLMKRKLMDMINPPAQQSPIIRAPDGLKIIGK